MLCPPEEKIVDETDNVIHKNQANGSKACQLRSRGFNQVKVYNT